MIQFRLCLFDLTSFRIQEPFFLEGFQFFYRLCGDEGPVDLMEFKIRSLYKLLGMFKGVFLGSGIEDPGIDHPGEDGI